MEEKPVLRFVQREAEPEDERHFLNAQIMLRRAVVDLCPWLGDGKWEVVVRPATIEHDRNILTRLTVGTKRDLPEAGGA